MPRSSGPAGVADLEADHHRVEAAEAGRGLSARPGDREATDGRELERLREVAQRQAVRGQQPLGVGPAHAGLQHRRPRLLVDLDQAVEAGQVEGDHAGVAVAVGDQSADHRRAAPERHQRDVLAHAPVEHRLHLAGVGGPDDGVRGVGAVAAADPDQVVGGLAPRVHEPGVVVGGDVLGADHRDQPGHQDVGERVGQHHVGLRDGWRGAGAEHRVDERAGVVGQRGGSSRVAPAGPEHLVRQCSHALQCDT